MKQSSNNITPFGSLNFVFNAIKRSEINTFLDTELGCRNFRDKYSYTNIVLSLYGNSLYNREYISDLYQPN